MKVTFTKTGARRYRVTIERPGESPRDLEPAPGYHDRLPHDAAHFIVESELKILGGIFGQMAAGGILPPSDADARQLRRSKKQRDSLMKENRDDALFSEHAVYAAQSRWEKQEIIPQTEILPADLARIIAKYDEFAAQWSLLRVGGSISLEWQHARSKENDKGLARFRHPARIYPRHIERASTPPLTLTLAFVTVTDLDELGTQIALILIKRETPADFTRRFTSIRPTAGRPASLEVAI